jgi:hemerythrin
MKTELQWNDRLSVGVSELDQQHKHVFELLKKLGTETGQNVDSETLSETMMAIMQLSERHVRLEEQYMQKYGYPEYESHHQEHLNFKRKIAELSLDVMNKDPAAPQKMFSFLAHYWKNHILNIDMKYKDFFAAKGVK